MVGLVTRTRQHSNPSEAGGQDSILFYFGVRLAFTCSDQAT
jgi:hypothetical protein